VRWTATLVAPASGTYRFATLNDDGIRVWVGDTLVIDDWRGHYPERHEGTVDLVAGTAVAIRVHYFEIDLGAEAHLSWTPPGGTEVILGGAAVTPATDPGDPRAPRPPFANPVVPYDCPDPGIFADGEATAPIYYMVCTGGSFPIRRSRDLVRWEDTGAAVLPAGAPPWAATASATGRRSCIASATVTSRTTRR
jgi:hypothetical protein